jgi:hypothetical protein
MLYNAQDVIEWLRKAVAEKGPDYVYRDSGDDGGACMYYSESSHQPRCLVGVALHKAGLIDYGLVTSRRVNEGVGIIRLAAYLNLPLSSGALSVLSIAQDEQDGGSTWGNALQRAEGLAERYART